MADYKIFKKGNYLIVIDENDVYIEDSSGDVLIKKTSVASTNYNITLKSFPDIDNVPFANILDEAGVAYADVATWELWYQDNTGFNPATVQSVAAVASGLLTHEANETDAHDLTDRLLLKVSTAETKSYFSIQADNASVERSGVNGSLFGATFTNATDSVTGLVNMATSTVTGSLTGEESSALNKMPINSDPTFTCLVKTSADITSQRLWVGLFSDSPFNTDNQDGESVAFRYSTAAGDTGWKAIVDNAGGQTISANIGTVAVDTYYLLKLRVDYAGGKCYFSVNGGVETEISAMLTTATTLGHCVQISTLVLAVRSFNFARLGCTFN